MLVPLEPAAPPCVLTLDDPPLMRSAQRRAEAPCAVLRRVTLNLTPLMVVSDLIIRWRLVRYSVIIEKDPPLWGRISESVTF